jgi:predicted nicotinamide N-methyase
MESCRHLVVRPSTQAGVLLTAAGSGVVASVYLRAGSLKTGSIEMPAADAERWADRGHQAVYID